MKIRSLAILLVCAASAAAQRGWQPPHPRGPHHGHNFRERKLYRPVGYANVLTGNFYIIGIGSKAGISPGAECERFLDKAGTVSLSLPVHFYGAGTLSFSGIRTGDERVRMQGIYAAPGILYHPNGNRQRTDFSIGAAFLTGSITKDVSYAASLGNTPSVATHGNLTGLMAQINTTFHTPEAFVFALHFGLGGTLSPADASGLLLQVGVKMGGRF